MTKKLFGTLLFLAALITAHAQTYTPLWIPPAISGTTFNLNLHVTNKFYLPGTNTITYTYNDADFWGPTLIMSNSDFVQIHLTNNLPDTTTTHWHGIHLPAIMDGGPRNTIAPGTTWSQSFYVLNKAATYWYHPHLHMLTQNHLGHGAGGFIIIKDAEESALNLPRTYGVDDIPLVLTSRRFYTTPASLLNQFNVTNGAAGSAYGDYELVNGGLNNTGTNVQAILPQQYVRLRILNAEVERAYNIGFTNSSGNITFYQICTDGGLVNAPVALTRIVLLPGERTELLLNLSAFAIGSAVEMISFNSSASLGSPLSTAYPGGENFTTGQFGSLINNKDFKLLHIVVTNQTANPVLTRPVVLTTNTFWTTNDVVRSRTIRISSPPGGVFTFDGTAFNASVINQTINLNAVEKWTITNNSVFSHAFHIHDIQFNIISRTGGSGAVNGIPPWEQGWKDTVYVQQNSAVTFITKFDHFASAYNPFMYHCHMVNHEDEGTMAQFLVVNNATENLAIASFTRTGFNNQIEMLFYATPGTTYSLQYTPTLQSPAWADIASVTSDGASVKYTETDPTRLAGVLGFYRVIMPLIPDANVSSAIRSAGFKTTDVICGPTQPSTK
ncbi:MAG: bilirubin oxidase [Verrucomicrobiales bacterium]|nr:bilirubin oxidase [Verrucomicrobiales bacterium]